MFIIIRLYHYLVSFCYVLIQYYLVFFFLHVSKMNKLLFLVQFLILWNILLFDFFSSSICFSCQFNRTCYYVFILRFGCIRTMDTAIFMVEKIYNHITIISICFIRILWFSNLDFRSKLSSILAIFRLDTTTIIFLVIF